MPTPFNTAYVVLDGVSVVYVVTQ